MNNLAIASPLTSGSSEVVQERGRVLGPSGEPLRVRTGSGSYACRRATSCLVSPEPGDEVLVALDRTGEAWVLAVLDKASGTRTDIDLPGDLCIRLGDGRFTVAAQEGVRVVTGRDIEMVSRGFNLHAVTGNLVVEGLTYLGSFVRSEVDKIKVKATSHDSVLSRFSQRVKNSYRTVEQLDRVKARQIDYAAETTACVRAENTVITAKELVKLDGEQIHLG